MNAILLCDIWPIKTSPPDEAEPEPEPDPGVRKWRYSDRGKEKKVEKEIVEKVKPYGRKGEVVTIISDHGNVLIVEGKDKFPVNRDNIQILNS